MNKTRTHTHDQVMRDTLGVLSQRAIERDVEALRAHDDLTLAIREMFHAGLDVNELSAATGLHPEDIRHRLECELFVGAEFSYLCVN
jgi:hypothetical protein